MSRKSFKRQKITTEAFKMIAEKSVVVASAYTMEGQSWPGGGDQSLPVL